MAIYIVSILALLVSFTMLACVEQLRGPRNLPVEIKVAGRGLAIVVFAFAVFGYWEAKGEMIPRTSTSNFSATLFGLVVAAALAGWVIYSVCCRAVAGNFAVHGRAFLARDPVPNRLRRATGLSLIVLTTACYSVAVLYISGVVGRLVTTVTFTISDVIAAVGVGCAEEIFFRGWIQNRLATWIGEKQSGFRSHLSIWLTAVLFACAHFQGPVKFVQVLPQGLIFGYVARRWGLAAAIFVHAATDCLHEVLIWGTVRMAVA